MQKSKVLPGKEVDVVYNTTKLRVNLDMGVGIGGDKWPAADKFCNLICSDRWKSFFDNQFTNARCLELGSGNGIVGIVLDKLFDIREVIITDLDSHVDHIQGNIVINNGSSRCVAKALNWMDHANMLEDQFECIFALECVYRKDLFVPLIKTIKKHSGPKTMTYLGLTRDFADPLFFKLLNEHGFCYVKLPDASLEKDVNNSSNPCDSSNNGLFIVYLR